MLIPAQPVKQFDKNQTVTYNHRLGDQTHSASTIASGGTANRNPFDIQEKEDTITISKKNKDYYGHLGFSSQDDGLNTEFSTRQPYEANSAANRILRHQLSKSILENLETLQAIEQPEMRSTHASGLMQNIISFRNSLPNDYLTDVLIALYDAMAVDSGWSQYSVAQYTAASETLQKLLANKKLNHAKVTRAINDLEDNGFVAAVRLSDIESLTSIWDKNANEIE